MDAKALAKSKRAHSLHHKKKHQPHQSMKMPSVGGSDDKKPSGKQAKEKSLQHHDHQVIERPQKSDGRKPLPSNWERYDENFDLGSEGTQLTDLVLPKSKGSDYVYLISEAKAQSQVQYTKDAVALVDEFINDSTQDFGPLLSAKGKNMLSWIEDDNFEFESQTSTSLEIPFLSLNLNSLAEQLSKAKLSERLYLDPDVLPLELLDDELQEYGEDEHNSQTRTSNYNMEVGNGVQHCPEPSSSSTINVQRDIPIGTFHEEEFKPSEQKTDEMLQPQGTDQSISPKSVSECANFESANAEKELDLLLNSLVEANTLNSSSVEIGGTHINDDIDNLLQETSKFTAKGNKSVEGKIKTDPVSKSELLDDFESWLDTI